MCNPISTLYPDHLLLKAEYQGYEYEVTRNHSYFRCGYVRIPPRHPWHGRDFDAVDADVYGGLSFAEADHVCDKAGPDDAWWLGFECAHALDCADVSLMDDGAKTRHYEMVKLFSILYSRGTVRSTEFVVGECERLIDQAVAAANRRGWRKLPGLHRPGH